MAAPKITLKKIFHDTFSPLMLSHGFKRFKDGYVRVYGEGILQAVTLASFAPNFAIRYACHPYWIFKWRSAGIGDLNNTHWMEEWNVHSFNGEFVSFGEYFKNKPETCYASMKLWLEITEKAILPDLDKIKTIDDYINYVITIVKTDVSEYLKENTDFVTAAAYVLPENSAPTESNCIAYLPQKEMLCLDMKQSS